MRTIITKFLKVEFYRKRNEQFFKGSVSLFFHGNVRHNISGRTIERMAVVCQDGPLLWQPARDLLRLFPRVLSPVVMVSSKREEGFGYL